MTVNKKIENALSNLVDGNIWPDAVPKENSTTEWITYVAPKTPVEYGDDEDRSWVAMVNVHYVHKGRVNYLKTEKEIRSRLRKAGFSLLYSDGFYDDDLASSHVIINANVVEDGD